MNNSEIKEIALKQSAELDLKKQKNISIQKK